MKEFLEERIYFNDRIWESIRNPIFLSLFYFFSF